MLIRSVVLIGLFFGTLDTYASDWSETERQARGQNVYFYAWGGSPAINKYIKRWGAIVKERNGVSLNHVKVDDISLPLKGIQTAKRIGKSDYGSVDVLWINGENFARMKRDGLLGASFVSTLPSAKNINLDDPTIIADFSVTTDGLEAPWGRARLVFIYDEKRISNPPRSMQEMYEYAKEHPGRLTYPEPPNFHGTTFLKQVLLETTQHIDWLSEPYSSERFDSATEPLWKFLDSLHPHLWRTGREFPDSAEVMMDLFSDGLLDITLSFNPNDASQRIIDGRFASSVRTYVHDGGTIGNTHFLAIPFNATARAGALVWINLLLGTEAQADKASPSVWGDPTVIDVMRLTEEDRLLFESVDLGPATLTSGALGTPLSEPHASWVEPLEVAWKVRYFGQIQ